MAVLLGVLVAASFGLGDFLGGRASRSAPTLTVLFVAQIAVVVCAALVCAFVRGHVAAHDLAFDAVGGCLNIIGIGLLYQGLAIGRMGVVAPLTAVVSATVPVGWGIANARGARGNRGARPTWSFTSTSTRSNASVSCSRWSGSC